MLTIEQRTYLPKASAMRGRQEIIFIKSTAAISSVFDAASVKLLSHSLNIELTVFTVSVINFSIPMHIAAMKRHLNVCCVSFGAGPSTERMKGCVNTC